jgi:hypothetical protein
MPKAIRLLPLAFSARGFITSVECRTSKGQLVSPDTNFIIPIPPIQTCSQEVP